MSNEIHISLKKYMFRRVEQSKTKNVNHHEHGSFSPVHFFGVETCFEVTPIKI